MALTENALTELPYPYVQSDHMLVGRAGQTYRSIPQGIEDAYRYVPPLASQFTHTYGTNSENPTKTDSTGRGLLMTWGSSPAAGDNVRAFTKDKTIISTSYDLIARVQFSSGAHNYIGAGLCVTDGTKFLTWGFSSNNTTNGGRSLKMDRWNTVTSNSSEPLASNLLTGPYEWLRIEFISGDPKKYYASVNGVDWILMLDATQTAFLTYTQVGFFGSIQRSSGSLPVSGTTNLFVNLLYFKDLDIVPVI